MSSLAGKTTTPALCTMCLGEGKQMKQIGPCRHIFCRECLNPYLTSQFSETDVCPCPTCKRECPMPTNGVDSLHDWDADDGTNGDCSAEGGSSGVNIQAGQHKCQLCIYIGETSSVAKFRCEKCGNLPMCTACTEEHQGLPATSHHVVTSLLKEETETGYDKCGSHERDLNMYCKTCRCPACSLCVLLGHGKHDVTEIEKVLTVAMDGLKVTLREGEVKVAELQQLRNETSAARDVVLNWRGKMIQQVEEATEKAINLLIEQKERLKNDITKGCDVSDLTDVLQKLPGVEQSIEQGLEKGQAVLKATRLKSEYILELQNMESDFGMVLKSDKIKRNLHWEKLKQPLPLFEENESLNEITLGRVGPFGFDNNLTAIMFRGIQYTDKTAIIHSTAACVGLDYYALGTSFDQSPDSSCAAYAHSTNFDYLKNVLTNVNGVVDVAVTVSGDLAVLRNVDDNKKMALTVFNPNTDDKVGKQVCNHLRGIVSFSVNILDQYILLSSKNHNGTQQITVLGKNGEVTCTLDVNQNDIRRITCGGKYIYSLGKDTIHRYMMKCGKVIFLNSVQMFEGVADDITATSSDDVYATIRRPTGIDVVKVIAHGDGCTRKSATVLTGQFGHETRVGTPCIDIRDNWMVLALCNSWMVYQLM